jgi:hypothetical protein
VAAVAVAVTFPMVTLLVLVVLVVIDQQLA